jgi:Holliday junction DNA helicase RuvA
VAPVIGRLRGEIIFKQPPQLVLDVQGVGYELEAPMSTFYDLPAVGQQVALFTHLMVRDDAHVLYGFAKDAERNMFRSLLRVNGVGAKMALAILSGMSGNEFARCVQENDTASLVRLPGIGKKTAERLIIEMRDRLDGVDTLVVVDSRALGKAGDARGHTPVADAVAALVALGYKPQEASRMVRGVDAAELSSEEIIRAALKAVAVR